MTKLALTLQLTRLKLLLWRLLATRAALRLVRRVCDGIGRPADRNHAAATSAPPR